VRHLVTELYCINLSVYGLSIDDVTSSDYMA
jgi:hypothetical protein